jgi:hypothetical protein
MLAVCASSRLLLLNAPFAVAAAAANLITIVQFFRSHFTVGSKAAFIALPTFFAFW